MIEGGSDIPGNLHMLALVLSHRYQVGLKAQNVGRH